MKHEAISRNTKKTLAESLKKVMRTKSLSKITVSEIINDCGVNRNLYGVVRSIVDSVAEEIGAVVEDDFKDFLTIFYTEALAGMLINYFRGSERRGRQELIDYILLILKNAIPNVLREKKEKATH
ncbi:MAG: hypothetical protein ACI4EG_05605 [Fusicatenibacter sp.]